MKPEEFYQKYEIATKTLYTVEGNGVVGKIVLSQCPYVWFGKLKQKIESGLVEYVMFKRVRFIND